MKLSLYISCVWYYVIVYKVFFNSRALLTQRFSSWKINPNSGRELKKKTSSTLLNFCHYTESSKYWVDINSRYSTDAVITWVSIALVSIASILVISESTVAHRKRQYNVSPIFRKFPTFDTMRQGSDVICKSRYAIVHGHRVYYVIGTMSNVKRKIANGIFRRFSTPQMMS